ncbi:MAG: hypothetical protein Q8942_15180 [Bacillota bacterium]|nr:hypothetical protein [Bacillota bacterium]
MDYITAQEAADKWGISRRRVQILCVNGRINGAVKKANMEPNALSLSLK